MIQFLLIPILIIISYVVWIFVNHRKFGRNELNLPPGSLGWPILGESLSLHRAGLDGVPERFDQERIEKHGNPLVFKTSLFGNRVAVLCGPAGNKFLFGNEDKLVAMWLPFPLRKLFGHSLVTAHGDEAKWLRKMMLPYLGHDACARHYAATMDEVTRRQIIRGKKEVKVYQTVKLYAFELACRLFMSLEEPNQIAELGSAFNILMEGIVAIPIDFPGTQFYSSRRAASAIRTKLMTIIKARRVELQEGKSASQDLLTHLITSSGENGRYLTEMEIANNILMLLFAGHGTSTITIALLMKRLGEHPDVYDKVLKEQLEICNAKEAGELLNWEDIQKMKYSLNVVYEVMRLTPPAIGAFREALVSFEYQGYTIPKGWKLYWSAAGTHKDSANFEDPTRFDPSRFEGSAPTPFSFVPFGGGPRMCIGKEFSKMVVLTFLHNIITNFKWDLLIPDEKIKYSPVTILEKGLPVRLHPQQA